MRIDPARSTSGTKAAKKAASTGDAAAFKAGMQGAAPVASAMTTAPAIGVGSVAALMALQAADDPLEKKRRLERRGRQLVDGLEQLKLGHLEGSDGGSTLLKLKTILDAERDQTDDPELEKVIDQIELRAEVELAKLQRSA